MPRNKDLKRLVRARMQKTGESYTTARAQLLKKRDREEPVQEPASTVVSPPDFADLTGMSDLAVSDKTGRTWEQWTRQLDADGCATQAHRDIAKHVHERYEISSWWAQTVTVGYERIKGLRDVGQRRDGSYDANKSKTLPVPLSDLYRAFHDADLRSSWLPEVDLTVRKATPEKSMRITWPDETSVEVYFTGKGEAKSRVAIQHRKLGSRAAVDEAKIYWTGRLEALAERLSSGETR